jgi:cation:H+ antiporter
LAIVIYDGKVVLLESLLLILSFAIYFAYTILYKDDDDADYEDVGDILPSREDRRKHLTGRARGFVANYKNIQPRDFILFTVGVVGLVIGAKYLIDSVIRLSEIFNLIPTVITISAVALGTSLPELLVSVRAAFNNKSEVALGNIFGSNVFNALIVVGIPGLFSTLEVDSETLTKGLPPTSKGKTKSTIDS